MTDQGATADPDTSAVRIREAQSHELDEIGRVTAGAYREFFGDEGPDADPPYLDHIRDVTSRARHTTVLVALLDEAIVGSLTLELDRRIDPDDPPLEHHRASIRMLGVTPAARGRGVGRALMRAAETRARAAGKTELTLHTTHLMTAARSMYESLGYEHTPDEVLPDGFVLLSYRRRL